MQQDGCIHCAQKQEFRSVWAFCWCRDGYKDQMNGASSSYECESGSAWVYVDFAKVGTVASSLKTECYISLLSYIYVLTHSASFRYKF